jgi:hypothetical protein
MPHGISKSVPKEWVLKYHKCENKPLDGEIWTKQTLRRLNFALFYFHCKNMKSQNWNDDVCQQNMSLFLHCLFNDAVSSWDNTQTNSKIINESRHLPGVTEEATKISFMILDVPPESWRRNLPEAVPTELNCSVWNRNKIYYCSVYIRC